MQNLNPILKSFATTIALLSAVCGLSASSAHAATYIVTNTSDSGTGSLRQAITSANATTAADIITFNISGTGIHTITPATQLPIITSPVTIDGTTQPGYTNGAVPHIELSGVTASKTSSAAAGINFQASNCTVSGLTINNWNGEAVYITKSTTAGCHIDSCLLGLNAGASAAAKNTIGVLIANGAHGNFIGGASGSYANYISGNVDGIVLAGAGTTLNYITGNTIGLSGNGQNAIPNTKAGVYIYGGATNNTIGGLSGPYGNEISGNSAGVYISGSTTKNNVIEGNVVGLDPTGQSAIPNDFGVLIDQGANNNIIGASNGGLNYISGNDVADLDLDNASSNIVAHNDIGLSATGTVAVNNVVGVNIDGGSQNNTIGPDNLIGGSTFGVVITGTNTSNNTVVGNTIGASADGTEARGNVAGVAISGGATNNTIGGTTAAQSNLISGNGVGVSIRDAGTSGNILAGNTIGPNAAGTAALEDVQQQGVSISNGASSNVIGGAIAGAGNVISGNQLSGVYITGNGTDTNIVLGNVIGLNPSATAALPNGQGIFVVEGARNTLIGGANAQSTNFISGNKTYGVRVAGICVGTVIEHNYIGKGANGNGAFSNGVGVSIEGDSQYTVIGSAKDVTDKDQIDSQANDISNNDTGVVVKGGLSYNNTIRGNLMANNREAIDLNGDGPNPNDDQDPDDGPNRLQNSPVITSVTRDSGDTGNEIIGTLNAAPSETYTVDFYFENSSASRSADAYVGSASVSTDATGNGSFDVVSANATTYDATHFIATATRAGTGDTSEFTAPISLPPRVSITSPANGSRLLTFSSINGTASDADGIQTIFLFLIRYSDGKYWNGTAWVSGQAGLSTTYDGNNGLWSNTSPLPQSFDDGDYDIIAIARDATALDTRTDSVITISNHTSYTYTGLAATCPYADSSACAAFVPGDARNFSDARNWSPNGVPGPKDTATIDGNYDVYLDINNHRGGSVVLGGLTLAGTLHGDSISFNPATGNPNAFTWVGGTLDFNSVTINAAGKMTISGNGLKDLGLNTTLTNAGMATITDAGLVRGLGSSIIDNLNGATFTLDKKNQVFTNFGGGNTFINEVGATFKKESKINDPTSVAILDSWNYLFKGNLTVNTGVVDFIGPQSLTFVNSLITGSGQTILSSGTLTTPSATVTVSGTTFELDGGSVQGTMNTTGATLNWTGGTFDNTLNVSANSSLNLSGTNLKDIGSHDVINNSGLTTLTDSGALRGVGNSTFNNKSGATFEVDSDADLVNFGGGNIFNNQSGATFKKLVGADTDTTECDWAFNNTGTTSVSQGVVALNGDTTSADSGAFNTTAPGIVRFIGGNHTLLANTAFNGTGKTQVAGATLTATGSVGAGTTSAGTTFELSSGEVKSSGSGTFNVFFGTFNWTGGTIGGVCNFGSGDALNLSGTALKDIDSHGIINNSGHATLSGTGVLRGLGTSTFNNKSGATFTLASDTDFVNFGGGNVFNNLAGSNFEKTVGVSTTLSQINWAFNNSGLTRCSQGVLALSGDTTSTDVGTFNPTSPGIVRFISGNHTLKTGTSFIGNGKTQITGGTLTETGNIVAGTSAAGTTLEVSGTGAIKGTTGTTLTCYGTVNWTGGTIGGILAITDHANLNLTGTALKDIDTLGVVRNAGTTTWTGPGALRGLGNSIFNNLSGGVFVDATDGEPFVNFGGGNSFNNVSGAIFEKTAGKGITTLDSWTFNAVGGQFMVNQGTLHSTGTLNINADTAVTGAGILQLSGTTTQKGVLVSSTHIIMDGLLSCTKTTPVCKYMGTGLFDWTKGTIGGTLNFAAGTKVNLSGTDLKDIGSTGIINNAGTFTWLGKGMLRGIGSTIFNNQAGGVFNVAADGDLLTFFGGGNTFNNLAGATFAKTGGTAISKVGGGWTFNNSGSVLANVGIATTSGCALEFDQQLNLLGTDTIGGARFTRFNGAALNILGTPTIANTTFEIYAGTTAGTGSVATTGTGVLKWTNGTVHQLTTAKNAVLTIAGTAQRDIDSKGILTNNGVATWTGGNIRGIGTSSLVNNAGATFTDGSKASLVSFGGGNLFKNAGTFKTGTPMVGKTTMDWGFMQLSTGLLSVDVTSTAATGFDLYSVGPATLAGTLQIVRPANFLPALNSTFKFLTHGTRSGTFATVQNTAIDSTRQFQVLYDPTDVTLKVVPKTANSPRELTSHTPVPSGTPTSGVMPVLPATEVSTSTPIPTEVPVPTPVPTTKPSGSVTLSSSSVNMAQGSIALAFTQRLDSMTASDLWHYSVTVNDRPLELQGVSIKSNVVILLLPEGAVQSGDQICVEWNGLKDARGSELGSGKVQLGSTSM
ncbi:hypothetical protein IAD21_00043 [Abditibacteriota bacterium]|nr:hypothetical protein IAD21_00043 [Abditibacteriota bacterium]